MTGMLLRSEESYAGQVNLSNHNQQARYYSHQPDLIFNETGIDFLKKKMHFER